MPMPSATVLLTRPEPDSRRFAALLPELPVVISPILQIVPVAHDSRRLAWAEALVFTSAHAVSAAGPGRGRLALCVGPRTAAVAGQAGFDVRTGPGDAEGLTRLIDASPVPLIYPRGRHVARNLPVEDMVVYDQQPLPLSPAAQHLLERDAPVILPLFSARSARLLSDLVGDRARAPLYLAAISESALDAWRGPRAGFILAEQPDATAMRNAVIRLFSTER